MSVEAAKSIDETKLAETPAVDAAAEAPVTIEAAKPAETAEPAEPVAESAATTNGVAKATTPATEGILGFKAPGFLKHLYYSKHFFWFSDEPVASESLNTFVRSEKADSPAHQHAAWARETGKGVLFHSKRAEDKAHPSGVILLHDVTNIAKEGIDALSFKLGNHTYKFEALNSAERDSWLAAIEKKVEEARDLKDEITGRDSYKKNLNDYVKSASPVNGVAAASRFKSKSKEPKEPKEPKEAAATAAGTETKVEETATPVAASAGEEKKAEEKKAQKERSQSRKRTSIFGSILPKKEDKEAEADAKKDARADKQEEAAAKKDESKPAEKDDKDEEKATTPTDKKSKRGSVFGTLFKKPTTGTNGDKTDKEAGPATPAKDNTGAAATTTPSDEPKPEKKSGFLAGLIKKADTKKEEAKETKKEEAKEDKAAEPAAVTDSATVETADGAAETPAPKDERPATEKRRPSLFASLGTIKRKNKEDKEATETSEETPVPETKREKAPLAKQIGELLRRPSKAVKSGEAKEAAPATTESAPVTEESTEAAAAANELAEPAKDTPVEGTLTQAAVDTVPDTVASTVHNAVTTAPEVKASA
ncbi:hypothetical protein DV736_g3949, partial [Chaetothyriales sp. CBS 134916]